MKKSRLCLCVILSFIATSPLVTVKADSPVSTPWIKVVGEGTNNWLILSNGFIVIPPFEFPNEALGADALRGGIFFSGAGSTGLDEQNNCYILNIVHRGANGGQLLISHRNICLEEQNGGAIILGNDGSGGGSVIIRYDDRFGLDLQPGEAGHTHPLMFFARMKDAFSNVNHYAYPAIIGYHGGDTNDAITKAAGSLGAMSPGELRFYSVTPTPRFGGMLNDGVEMGRMETNGWNLRGTLTRQRALLDDSDPQVVLDLGTNYFIDVNLKNRTTAFTTTNWHGGSNNVQNVTLLIRAGPSAKKVIFPNWAVLSENGTRKMPSVLKAYSVLRIQLEIVGDGGDANTLARWTLYHRPPQHNGQSANSPDSF
jgi:hypothetical protein